MIKAVKTSVLRAGKRLGLFRAVLNSGWRRRRLLVLGFHGVALDDEHQWNPGIYLGREEFAGRLQLIADGRYNVLLLDEALQLLSAGSLPERSVALTFDDGHYDFWELAFPLLQAHGFAATVFLTTYYCDFNVPVFDLICSYILWKARGSGARHIMAHGEEVRIDPCSPASQRAALLRLHELAARHSLSGAEKDVLAESLAGVFGLDYASFKARRLLHLLNREEVRNLAGAGVDFQLHSHTHRLPLEEAAFRSEIQRNAIRIGELASSQPKHLCYPSGLWHPCFFPWLEALSIRSAATCRAGLASASDNLHAMPRIMDHGGLSMIEFEAWLTGAAVMLPKPRRGGDGRIRRDA